MGSNAERTLRVLEILKDTDPDHCLTANQISAILERRWGIKATDKVIRRDIHALQDCEYDVELNSDGKQGWYMEGAFEDWELRILMDAVRSAKFLDDGSTDVIVKKLRGLASEDGRKTLGLMTIPAEAKRGDKTTKYAVSNVMQGIKTHKKILFDYVLADEETGITVPKHSGAMKPVSPYALVWRSDRYYLIGNYEGKELSYYRLDRIRRIRLTEEQAVPLRDILGSDEERKLKQFVQRNIYSKKGEKVRLELALLRNGADSLRDSFGRDVTFINNADGTVSACVTVSDSDGLYAWLMHHSAECTVIKPEAVRNEMRRRLKRTLAEYE